MTNFEEKEDKAWFEIDLDNIGKNKEKEEIEVKEEDDDNKNDVDETDIKPTGKSAKEAAKENEKEEKDEEVQDVREKEERPKFNKGSRAEKRIRDLWQQKTQAEQRALLAEAKLAEREKTVRISDASRQGEKIDTLKKLVGQAELAYEKAEGEGDVKAKLKAQKDLFDAQIDLKVAVATKAHIDGQIETEEEEETTTTTSQRTPPAENPYAKEWASRNASWFGKNREETAIAFALDQVLASEGSFTPDTEEYWEELDKRLKKKGLSPAGMVEEESEEVEEEEKPKKQLASSNTNLKRSVNKGNESASNMKDGEVKRVGNKIIVRLTDDERQAAKRLGVTPERFARQKARLNETNQEGSSGWSEIDLS